MLVSSVTITIIITIIIIIIIINIIKSTESCQTVRLCLPLTDIFLSPVGTAVPLMC